MRRYICWLLVIIVTISQIPARVGAIDELPVADGISSAPEGAPITPVQDLPPPEGNDSAVEPSPIPKDSVSSSVSAAPTLVQVLATPETTPDSILTTFDVSTTIEYLELYNQSDAPIDVSALKFHAFSGDSAVCDLAVARSGWLLPNNYLMISSPTATAKVAHMLSGDCDFTSDITRLEVYYHDSRIQLIDGIATDGSSWMRHAGNVMKNTQTQLDCTHKPVPTVMKQTGSIQDYVRCPRGLVVEGSDLYSPPTDKRLKIVEILPNARSCLPSDVAFDCSDYIKIKNTTGEDINLAEFRVRTGAKFGSATSTTSFNWQQPTLSPDRDELMLPAGEYFLLRLRNDGQVLNLSGSEGNVWIEDYYGIQAYDEVSYAGMDISAAAGKSWAYDESSQTWRTGIPSPLGGNTFPSPEEPGKGNTGGSSLVPCRDNQYRSEETNRCRNLVVASDLTPCKEGQYRSEETNRCRSIASAAAVALKPCADDQFRSPETNRCRKIASSDDVALADCGEGRERNPETNRCRNSKGTSVPSAAFAVEPVKDAGKTFVGWWALGGVGLLAMGYAAWEWRREMRAGIQKATSFFTSRK